MLAKVGFMGLCVAAPAAWGLCVYALSNRIEAMVLRHGRRKGQDDAEATLPPLEYYI